MVTAKNGTICRKPIKVYLNLFSSAINPNILHLSSLNNPCSSFFQRTIPLGIRRMSLYKVVPILMNLINYPLFTNIFLWEIVTDELSRLNTLTPHMAI